MIVCFGEIMLRFSPEPDSFLIEQATNFRVVPGGSESNVAIALRRLGNKTAMATILPDDVFGHKLIRYLKWHDVDTDRIIFHKTGRVGLYFTEKGSGARGYRVFYDRENSAYNYLNKYVSNIDHWLKNCSWLHLSGIALATSRNAADFTLILTKKAKKKGIKISFDINNRESLWKWCKNKEEKSKYLMGVAERSTILLGNETDFEVGLFGQPELNQKEVLERLIKISDNGTLAWVAISQRESKSADINNFGGFLYDFQGNSKIPKKYTATPNVITEIVDRLGTGDAFCGAILDGFIKTLVPEAALKRAIMLGALKHGISGDACTIDLDLFNKSMADNSGKISR